MSLAQDFSKAACIGDHDLFDSTHPEDHAVARHICRHECPVRLACASLLVEMKQAHGTQVRGTWAGELMAGPPKRRKPAKVVERKGACWVCATKLTPGKERYCGNDCQRLARNARQREQYAAQEVA